MVYLHDGDVKNKKANHKNSKRTGKQPKKMSDQNKKNKKPERKEKEPRKRRGTGEPRGKRQKVVTETIFLFDCYDAIEIKATADETLLVSTKFKLPLHSDAVFKFLDLLDKRKWYKILSNPTMLSVCANIGTKKLINELARHLRVMIHDGDKLEVFATMGLKHQVPHMFPSILKLCEEAIVIRAKKADKAESDSGVTEPESEPGSEPDTEPDCDFVPATPHSPNVLAKEEE